MTVGKLHENSDHLPGLHIAFADAPATFTVDTSETPVGAGAGGHF